MQRAKSYFHACALVSRRFTAVPACCRAARPRNEATGSSLHVERFGSGRLAIGIGGDLVDPRLRLPQQFLASRLQRVAALVDGDGFLQRHLAFLEPLHDRFKLLDRALEAQLPDVHLGVFGHVAFPDAPCRRRGLKRACAGVLWRGFTPPSMPGNARPPTLLWLSVNRPPRGTRKIAPPRPSPAHPPLLCGPRAQPSPPRL